MRKVPTRVVEPDTSELYEDQVCVHTLPFLMRTAAFTRPSDQVCTALISHLRRVKGRREGEEKPTCSISSSSSSRPGGWREGVSNVSGVRHGHVLHSCTRVAHTKTDSTAERPSRTQRSAASTGGRTAGLPNRQPDFRADRRAEEERRDRRRARDGKQDAAPLLSETPSLSPCIRPCVQGRAVSHMHSVSVRKSGG